MMRSLFSGVSGLKNHQTRMDVIGNNISNVNTTGFKSSRVVFSDMLSQNLQGASAPQESIGGTNPKQIGLGSSVAAVDMLFTNGSVQSTGVNTDLALSSTNSLFIMKTGTGSTVYTRNGDFQFDANGNYVQSGNGYYVQGWMREGNSVDTQGTIKNICIPSDLTMDPAASTQAVYTSNLNSGVPTITSIDGGVDPVKETRTYDNNDGKGVDYTGQTMKASADSPVKLVYRDSTGADLYKVEVPEGTYTYGDRYTFENQGANTLTATDDQQLTIHITGSDLTAKSGAISGGKTTWTLSNGVTFEETASVKDGDTLTYEELAQTSGKATANDKVTIHFEGGSTAVSGTVSGATTTWTLSDGTVLTQTGVNVAKGNQFTYIDSDHTQGTVANDAAVKVTLTGGRTATSGVVSGGATTWTLDDGTVLKENVLNVNTSTKFTYDDTGKSSGTVSANDALKLYFDNGKYATSGAVSAGPPPTTTWTLDDGTTTLTENIGEIDVSDPAKSTFTYTDPVTGTTTTVNVTKVDITHTLEVTSVDVTHTLTVDNVDIEHTLTVGSIDVAAKINYMEQEYLKSATATGDNSVTITMSDNTTYTRTSGEYSVGHSLPIVTTLIVYDTLGASHELPVYFTMVDSEKDEWEVSLTDDGTSTGWYEKDGSWTSVSLSPQSKLKLKFTDHGAYDSGDGKATLTLTNGSERKQDVSLDFTQLTQYASSSTIAGKADGNEPGALSSISIDRSGTITGVYTNGMKRAEAQIALQRFNNPGGLTKVGESLYEESNNSGLSGSPNTADALGATITPSALEMSNVDIANEFTDMIITQRGFQSNSKIITTSDEMLETLINLKR